MLDRDGNNEMFLDIARSLGQESIVEYFTQNYPHAAGEDGGFQAKLTQ